MTTHSQGIGKEIRALIPPTQGLPAKIMAKCGRR